MMSDQVQVTFKVKVTTQMGETVCIVGDCKELGNWKPQGVVPLRLDSEQGVDVWSLCISLPRHGIIQYRYLVAHLLESDHEGESQDMMIQRWETHLKPREVNFALPTENGPIAEFGRKDGEVKVGKGWLTGQTEIQLRLHSSPMTMWKSRYSQQIYRLKCTPIDLRYNDMPVVHDDESCHDLPTLGGANSIYVSIVNSKKNTPREQPQFGTTYHDNDYMLFRSQTFERDSLGFQFDFYACHVSADETEEPKHIGSAYLLPVNLKETLGKSTIPITGLKTKPIGQLTVEYLIIKSLPAKMRTLCDMKVSYARYWNRHRGPVDVGHRGLGSSYCPKGCATVKENTIASLSEAGGHGADFVEFDVQLSQDEVPVIYHDFIVGLSMKKRHHHDVEWFEIPVQDLSLAQLQLLKIDHAATKIPIQDTESNDPTPLVETRPFPTLAECFEHLDPQIGFNVEIKYCMYLKNGGREDKLRHFAEHNRYINTILDEVLRQAGSRRIIFSSFDPDVCTMLQLKQNRYPVLFLCFNETEVWPSYKDPRTWSIIDASTFAQGEELLGVNPYMEDLLKNPKLVQDALNMGLVVIPWGPNDKAGVRQLKEMGVDGVIYDRIHEVKAEEKVFKMEYHEKLALLRGVGAITGKTDADDGSASKSMEYNPDSPNFAGIFSKNDANGSAPNGTPGNGTSTETNTTSGH